MVSRKHAWLSQNRKRRLIKWCCGLVPRRTLTTESAEQIGATMQLLKIEPDFGPWVGVPKERQRICAVEGCEREAYPQPCPMCAVGGKWHHHGCIHYQTLDTHGLTFREGWGYLCHPHYDIVLADLDAHRKQ